MPDEPLHRRVTTQPLGDRNSDQQKTEADRQQPQQVKPPAASHPDPRSDPVDVRNRPRPGSGVDHILARSQLRPIAASNVWRNGRWRSRRQILRSGTILDAHQAPSLPPPGGQSSAGARDGRDFVLTARQARWNAPLSTVGSASTESGLARRRSVKGSGETTLHAKPTTFLRARTAA